MQSDRQSQDCLPLVFFEGANENDAYEGGLYDMGTTTGHGDDGRTWGQRQDLGLTP